MIFLGNDRVAPPVLTLWLARLLLFRVEFGAGLIKMRGDPCWRDLTCLYYHHETQPMPGPLSWFFHRLPKPSRGSDGSRDRERAFSTRELAVEYQERHAGEVVAVQVREHDCVNAVRVYAGTLQTN